MSPELWEIVLAVVVPLIVWGLRKLSGMSFAKQHEDELIAAVASSVQRAKDKYLAELEAARDPDSPGGVEITDEEKSKARQVAFDYTMASLKGPALKYAKDRGEDYVKGLIGGLLDRVLGSKAKTAPASS